MKHIILACALLSASLSAAAKDKLIPLSEADASSLHGKTLALTIHERPTFIAMTAGKATFGLFGVAAMVSAGNKLVDENHIDDPAGIVRTNLANLLRDVDGMQLMAADATATKAKHADEIAKTHPEADYVLDVRSGGWSSAYFPTQWGRYWIGYSVQVQLVDTKSGRQLSNAGCNASTHENPNPPSREQLEASSAKLLKDVTTGLGWTCIQLLAKEQLHIPADKIAATPAEFVDPLAALAKAGSPASSTAGAAAPVTPAAPAAADPPQNIPMDATSVGVAPPATPAPAPTDDGTHGNR